MFSPLTVAVAVTALLLAAWCGYASLRDQPVKDWHYLGMAVVLLLTLVQLAVGLVRLAGGERPAEGGTATFVSYLFSVSLCLPVVGVVALGERSRWGSATVAAGALVLAALQLRLADVWAGGTGA
ncbi:hypothetical protein [Streptomyces marincola]|uniref:Integral membrane protein n=1 Tax=Streptomyces marincola TaxID=2878388 RepID=A0A1W7D3L5_9ACTN|nr:hypothetical protein [Streptomyces marincola]ARQ71693.1 hypothetical protein CAG99_25230 [Streptomyces marincola]UCM86855.1 hypothetical protein LC193_02260 [Streptomyces marincola]